MVWFCGCVLPRVERATFNSCAQGIGGCGGVGDGCRLQHIGVASGEGIVVLFRCAVHRFGVHGLPGGSIRNLQPPRASRSEGCAAGTSYGGVAMCELQSPRYGRRRSHAHMLAGDVSRDLQRGSCFSLHSTCGVISMSAMVHGNQTCSNGGVTIAGSVVSSTRPIAEWGGRRACARVWVVRVVG